MGLTIPPARSQSGGRRPPRLLFPFLASLVLLGCLPGAAPPDRQEAARRLVARGGSLYTTHCQVCHGDRDMVTNPSGAPAHNQHGHTWHHPDPQLKDWIRNGKASTQMPPYGDRVDEADAEAILAFIKTWWTPEQYRIQADITRNYEEFLEGR